MSTDRDTGGRFRPGAASPNPKGRPRKARGVDAAVWGALCEKVTVTLDPLERTVVESHLEGCEDCQAELRFDHRLRGAISDLPLNVEEGWTALRKVIESQTIAHQPKVRSAPNFSAFFNRPLKLGWFLAAEAVFAAVALAMLGHPAAPVYYRALATPRAGGRGDVIVIFSPDAREREMRAALVASGARVTDGPTAAGAYVLSIPTNRDMGLAKLRASADVTLAEPLDLDKPL